MIRSNGELITSLSYPGDCLPEDALCEAIKRYDDIKAELHTALKLSPDEIDSIEDAAEEKYMLKFFAMYLAAEKRDNDSFPLILNFFATYAERAWDSLGNISTRDLGRILASVCHGDVNALKSAIILEDMDNFARIACFDALGVLMCEGDLPREKLVEWFRTWLRGDMLTQLERSYLANSCMLLALKELKEDLLVALKSRRIDTEDINVEDIEHELPVSEISDFSRQQFSPVDDATSLILECSLRGYLSILFIMFDRTEFDALMPFFQQDRGKKEEGKFMPEFLHGFMFGIVVTPELILPSEWIPDLFDGDMPGFKSGEEAEAAHLGLMLFYNRLNEDHLEGTLTDPFDAVDNIGKALAPMTREWCRGFARAMGLRPECWLPQENFNEISNFTKAITTILMLSDQRKADDLLKISGKKNTNTERKKLLKGCLTDLPLAIETLIERARAHGTAYIPDALRHLPAQSTKVGRNTLCPCGSGKKFKKCCGIPGKVVH